MIMLYLRLLELRKSKRLTQAKVADFLKITPQTYSLYETGKHNINNETLCLLADYFEVSTDYLLGRQDALPSFLSEEERTLLAGYRTLDERGRQTVQNNVSFESSQNGKRN
jgi:transcriptional regulator with XRE-family HTH domain